MNCRVEPRGITAFAGEIERLDNVAAVTVRAAEPCFELSAAVTVVDPTWSGVASPREPSALDSVATAGTVEAQAHCAVRSWLDPSEKVPTAVKARVLPKGSDVLAGVTEIEASVAPETVTGVVPMSPERLAVTVVVPLATAVPSPRVPTALDMVSREGSVEFQDAEAVTSWVVLSEYVPVAMKAWVVPTPSVGLTGVTANPVSVAEVTSTLVAPLTPAAVAVTCVAPGETPVTCPFEPATSETVTTPSNADRQEAVSVTSCVVASEKTPVADSGNVLPRAIDGPVGLTDSDINVAVDTVSALEARRPLRFAAIEVTPAASIVATPRVSGAFEMVATLAVEEVQLNSELTSWVVPSENPPVAMKRCVVPGARVGLVGVMDNEVRVALVTMSSV